MKKETYRREYVRCGKRGCKRCPHGPYWYAYWKEGKRLRKRYCGKTCPGGGSPDPLPNQGNRLDDIFHKQKATLALAKEILGFVILPTASELRTIARRKLFELHPDRGGNDQEFRRYSAAWAYVQDFLDNR